MADGEEIRNELSYSKEHEWVRIEGDIVVVGITDYAQNSLHEITYVEPPEAGSTVKANGECGLIESMKASSEIFSPLSGEVIEVNAALEDAPELVNESPYDEGWIYKIKPSNLNAELADLLDGKGYKDYIATL